MVMVTPTSSLHQNISSHLSMPTDVNIFNSNWVNPKPDAVKNEAAHAKCDHRDGCRMLVLQLSSPPFVSKFFCGMMRTVHSQRDTDFLSPVLMPVKGYDHSIVCTREWRITIENHTIPDEICEP